MIITWLVTWQLHVKRKHKLPSMTHELPLIITCAITWLVTWQLHVKDKHEVQSGFKESEISPIRTKKSSDYFSIGHKKPSLHVREPLVISVLSVVSV